MYGPLPYSCRIATPSSGLRGASGPTGHVVGRAILFGNDPSGALSLNVTVLSVVVMPEILSAAPAATSAAPSRLAWKYPPVPVSTSGEFNRSNVFTMSAGVIGSPLANFAGR